MFVILQASVSDPFGCSPEESHAELAFKHPDSHALLPASKHPESPLHQLPVSASEALSCSQATGHIV